jgi:hypothetical protein
MRHRGRFLNQDVERSSGDQFATVSANLPSTTPANASPAQPAAQSNPHRRPTTHQPPRVLSSEAFGRRPPTRTRHGCTGRRPAGIRNPSRKRTLDDVRQVCPVWLRKRSFEFCSPIGSSMTQAEVLIQQDLQRPSPNDPAPSSCERTSLRAGFRFSVAAWVGIMPAATWRPPRNGNLRLYQIHRTFF